MSYRGAQGFEQAVALHEHRHGRALTTWKHDAIEALEVFTRPHQSCARARLLQGTDMLGKSTLHREDPDEGPDARRALFTRSAPGRTGATCL